MTEPVTRAYRPLRRLLCLALIGVVPVGGVRAQVGWVVSETLTVPRTDFSVTGPPPYACVSPEEQARQAADPVYQVQKWLLRLLQDRFDYVVRLQTEDNCAEVCALLPPSAEAITGLQGYARAPGGPYTAPTWPGGPSWGRWEEEVSRVSTADGTRVCAVFHNWSGFDYEVFLTVYYSD